MHASFSAFQVFFCHRILGGNNLAGKIPSQISTLTALSYLYAPSLNQLIECWSCLLSVGHAPLSHFQFFFLLGALPAATMAITATNSRVPYLHKYLLWSNCHLCTSSNCSHMLVSVGPCAFSQLFKRSAFIYRDLSHNKLGGIIPAAISTLVKLTVLCAHTSFNLVSVGQSILV